MMNMRICASLQHQTPPRVTFPKPPNVRSFFRRKDKVVFVVGPTGTGKSRLAIDLATRIPAEVINSDKIQVYKGLDVLTNKVTADERRGVPHHLLGVVDDPSADFTADDFRLRAAETLDLIISRDRLPIIAGGSNSFVEALAFADPKFRLKFDCCFIWVDVAPPVLYSFVSDRVDRMVESGLIEEARAIFDPENRDFSQGIRRAIGVPELDEYFRSELDEIDPKTRGEILESGILRIKENNCELAWRQLQKIRRIYRRWNNGEMYRVDATEVFRQIGGEESDKAWEKLVAEPSTMIVKQFLYSEGEIKSSIQSNHRHYHNTGLPVPAMAAL